MHWIHTLGLAALCSVCVSAAEAQSLSEVTVKDRQLPKDLAKEVKCGAPEFTGFEYVFKRLEIKKASTTGWEPLAAKEAKALPDKCKGRGELFKIVLHPDVYPGSLVFIGISNNGTQNPFELCLATFQPDKESVQDQVPVLPCIATEQKMPKNVHDLWPKDESSFSLKQLKCSAPDKKQILISSADLLRATLLKDTSSDLPAWLNMPQWHGLEGSEPAIRQEVAFKACRSKHLHRVTLQADIDIHKEGSFEVVIFAIKTDEGALPTTLCSIWLQPNDPATAKPFQCDIELESA